MSKCDKISVLPNIPPLYFLDNVSSASSCAVGEKDVLKNTFQLLPSELEVLTVTSYMDWGDLAKLSTVHKSWSRLIEDSASKCNPEGKWELALALLNGTHGLLSHPARAVRYLETLSKEMRHVPAMVGLARCHLTGCGFATKNTDAGVKWLSEAAIAGDPSNCQASMNSAHELACIYERGQYGIEIDVNLAAKWFLYAAERGLPESMAEYALCCELGCGVAQDDGDALGWYVRAAEAGHSDSNFSVGEHFEAAKGVPQSDTDACMWYYRGAMAGDRDSVQALRRLEDIARIVLPPQWGRVLAV